MSKNNRFHLSYAFFCAGDTRIREVKSQLISVLVPDGPEGKFALHLIDDDGCNFGSRDMPFAMGKTDFKAIVTPINELVYKGVFNFPETSRKVECKVRRRWCEAAFEHRSAGER